MLQIIYKFQKEKFIFLRLVCNKTKIDFFYRSLTGKLFIFNIRFFISKNLIVIKKNPTFFVHNKNLNKIKTLRVLHFELFKCFSQLQTQREKKDLAKEEDPPFAKYKTNI